MKLFNQVKTLKGKRNNFDLRHDRKFSLNMGELIPFLCEEVVPGDTWKVQSEVMVRFAPMLAPVMHRIDVHMHLFFVPNRLLWSDWKDFITGGEDGNFEGTPPYQTVTSSTYRQFEKGTLADYLGYNLVNPPPPGEEQRINAMPFRAYQLIYDEYYRDQNLVGKIINGYQDIGGGSDSSGNRYIRTRAWEKDYFTSCLPFAQKGGEVVLPIGGQAPLKWNREKQHIRMSDSAGSDGSGTIINAGLYADNTLKNTGEPNGNLQANTSTGSTRNAYVDVEKTHYADLSEATAASINDLRRATRLQEWLERNARGGSRYIESILHHFGVKSSDARLQRPEFLGGQKNPVVISEVLQHSKTDTIAANNTPLGEMAGHGISVGSGRPVKRFFEEHGYIMGIMSIIPRTSYQHGIRKMFYRGQLEGKFDYYWQEFAHLGEQEVLNKELYNDPNMENQDEVFGYQSRYAEYKYIPSTVHGDFKDDLAFWHLGRQFDGTPYLNQDFIECNPREDIFAVTEESVQKLWCQVFNNVTASRLMPKFGTPYL